MAADDLSAPLGHKPSPKRPKIPGLPIAPAMLIAVVFGLALAVFAGWVTGGERSPGRRAVAVVNSHVAAQETKAEARGRRSRTLSFGPRRRASRQIPAVLSPSSTVRPASGRKFRSRRMSRGRATPVCWSRPVTDLLPKIAADGTRPSDAYAAARPAAEATDRRASPSW